MVNQDQKLANIINLGREISEIIDVDVLLDRTLQIARDLTNADAGSIYIKENDKLKFYHTQNDTLQKRLPPGKKLIYSIFSIPINSRSIAGCCASAGDILNIPDVHKLPKDASYSFDSKFDELSHYHTRSMLTLPLKNQWKDIIGILQLINAQDDAKNIMVFSKEDESLIMHFANLSAGALERAQLTRALILRMIKMAELRDPMETAPHVNRVAAYTVEIYEAWARKRGISRDEVQKNKDILRMAAMLHDVGKMAVSDLILQKPARLTDEDREVMQQHTFLGARLFADPYSNFDEAAFKVTLNHHERWDGNGYPGHINPLTGEPIQGYETKNGKARGKKGEEIHHYGRLVAIADVYDALSSNRVYKEAWKEDQVFDTLMQDAGKQFDPEMIEAFFDSIDVIRNIAERYSDK